MTAFATQPDADTAARTREAWTEYRESLRTLEGGAYEEAEPAAWEQLQAALGELEDEDEDERPDLAGRAGPA